MLVAHFLVSTVSPRPPQEKLERPWLFQEGSGRRLLPTIPWLKKPQHTTGQHTRQHTGQQHAAHPSPRQRPHPRCWEVPQLRALLPAASKAPGWVDQGGWIGASQANATLRLPFSCVVAGCGLLLGTTKSYQPLGIMDVYVDGRLVIGGYSNAERNWALARAPMWTVNHFVKAVAPGAGGLAAGTHLLEVVCRGETLAELSALPSNYAKHEVHVRNMVVLYEQKNGSFAFARRRRRRALR